jgi:hypothetical protein
MRPTNWQGLRRKSSKKNETTPPTEGGIPEPMQQQKPQQINVSLDEKVGEGTYSNLALIAFSPAEFFIDFARLAPGIPKAAVQARIIMTPAHVKFLLNALKENIERFENQFGEIKLHGQPQQGGGFGFKPPESPVS